MPEPAALVSVPASRDINDLGIFWRSKSIAPMVTRTRIRGVGDAGRRRSYKRENPRAASPLGGRRMLAANCPQKLTRVRALAGIFLVVDMRATLLAHTLAAALCGKGRALGNGGRGSALAVGFSNDFVAHGNLSSLVELAIVTHSLGLFLAAGNRQRVARSSRAGKAIT